ncbi:hypothetical protein CIB84_011681 [Bambusicola thoracicus]|uniref:Uncharacterized protein n=1 Tax=Bambusicola thoracicus TaxID=9083 RepID=A0A2P4SKD9_BAMTH|nr:hypothetical protein CIB84_011681 [Bambusicola thoracicus]
MSLRGSYMWQL